jgi:Ser/Thr protein kinase RdoA (MazF antagonist)
MPVPVQIPTTNGRYFAAGLVVMTYVDGGPPETEADWRRVADTLRQLHRLTHGWPQRPGLAIVDRPPARRDRDEGRPPADAARRCRSMPSSVGATHRPPDLRRARRPQPGRSRPVQ